MLRVIRFRVSNFVRSFTPRALVLRRQLQLDPIDLTRMRGDQDQKTLLRVERGGEQPRFWHYGGSIILFKIHPNAGIAGRGHGPFDGHLVGGVKVEVDHRFPITVDGHIRVDFIRNIFAKFQRTAALF